MVKSMRYFKVAYVEGRKQREKYLMLKGQPKPGQKLKSPLAVEILHPDIGYGGIYGGNGCSYVLFVPKDSKIEEISPIEFANVIIKSLNRNYVPKTTLSGLLGTLV